MSDELTPDELAELKRHYGKLYTHPLSRLIADHERLLALVGGLAGMLRKARLFVNYSQFCAGYQDENGKSQSYRSEEVQAEIDAALAALEPGENSPQPSEQP